MTEQQLKSWEIGLGMLLMWAFGFVAGRIV
jgi:hypothetical protein